MKTDNPILYIFSGLPSTGKSTLAQKLAWHTNSVHLRIDTIEQALRDLCSIDVQGEGYRLSYRIVEDNLKLGLSVIADSCNPIALTRNEWEQIAINSKADFINIEVICSDKEEHKKRAETRISSIEGLILPDWSKIQSREYHPWTTDRIIIDTSGKTGIECFNELNAKISSWGQ